MELKVVWLTIFATTLSSASSTSTSAVASTTTAAVTSTTTGAWTSTTTGALTSTTAGALTSTTAGALTSTTTTALTTDPTTSTAAQSGTTQTSTVTSSASGGSSGSTMTPADFSSAAASPDVCYEFTLQCSESSNKSECFNTHTENNEDDTCDRNGQYCMITSTENSTGTIFQTQCVDQDCDRSKNTSDTGDVVTSNCCDTSRCNVHTLLNAGSPVIPGVLLLLLLAVAAAAVAGTNIVT